MIVFVAGTTAVKAGTACVFFWRGPRRRRQGRHVFLVAGSTKVTSGATASGAAAESAAEVTSGATASGAAAESAAEVISGGG